VCHVRLGVVPFFGNRNLFRKKLGPKKFIRDKSGDKLPVGTTHGDFYIFDTLKRGNMESSGKVQNRDV